MEVTKRVACTLLVVLSVVCQLSSATVVVCDPSVGPQSVTVGLNDHVVYTSKNYPLAYPQGSCDVSFYPATSNTKLVLVFEYFRAGNDNDTLDFLANVTGSAPGSKPELQIVDTLAGDFWPTYYRYPENINEPTQNFPGIIQTRFTARSNLLAPGFIAHIISYDVSKPYECQSGTTVLQAGDSLLTVNTGAPFNDAAPATCDWSVKPADGSTLLRTIVNYVSQTNGQVLVSTNGQQTVNVSGSGSNSFQEPQLIFDNIANQIDFKFSKLGHNWEDGIFTYSIVVQAFSSANTPQSTCPDTGKTFDLVGDGSNAMTPSYIKTQTDFTKFYENNQRCTWAATITDPTKYAIVSYIHINQFEDCCDMFMTTTDNGQSWKKMIWNTDYPKQSQLMVKFESDSIRTELGGMFELRAVPLFDTFYAGGNSVMLPQNGVELNIKTPGYGFAIPRGIDLTYTFTSPSNPWVRFRLSNMYATNAIYQGNNFTIYDGTSTSSPVIGMINNEYMMENENDPNRAYKNFFSTQPHLTVRWQSSASYAVVSPSQVVGLQLSLAGVNNKVQVLPNFGNGDDGE
uniref:Uncharacterized protein n=1 Tax=Plectus sambesii TaxID=2011161 RepID=A0A914UPB4_9BILA